MAQQFDYPKTETELREIQDKLYQYSIRSDTMRSMATGRQTIRTCIHKRLSKVCR